MKQRGYGVGKIDAVKIDGVTQYRARWRDATGSRKQRIVASDRRTAEIVLHQIIAERDKAAAGIKSLAHADIKFDDLRKRYLAHLPTYAKSYTVGQVTMHLERMRKLLGNVCVRDITKQQLADFQRRRLAEGKAHNTINRSTNAIVAMLNFAVRFDIIDRNPLAGFRRLPIGRKHPVTPFPRRAVDRELRRRGSARGR